MVITYLKEEGSKWVPDIYSDASELKKYFKKKA